jgi:hypothetical protein
MRTSMVMVMVMVMIVSLFAGGCAPRAKPVGYVGGTVLAVAGTALVVHASSQQCEAENIVEAIGAVVCESAAAGEAALGVLTLLTGTAILIAAAASPSAPEPGPPGAAAPLPAASPPAPGAAPPTPAAAPPSEEDEEDRWRALQRALFPPAPSRASLAFD